MDRTQVQIFLGTIIVVIISVIVIVYGLNERDRMAEQEKAYQARAIETGATLFEAQCSRCHGTQGLGIPGLCPPLNDRYFFDDRLGDVAWTATLEDYIVATASSGRLTSTRQDIYPGQGTPAMPSFSQQFGGPLREDEIRTIASFIMNWDETAGVVEVPPAPEGPVVGTDITKELPAGDPDAGEALSKTLACNVCHIDTPTGPFWPPITDAPGIGDRAETIYTHSDYNGAATSSQEYLFESIVTPGAYIVTGFPEGTMPNTYGSNLSDQDMADLIAYLKSLK